MPLGSREALAPYARALRDFQAGDVGAVLGIHSDLGEDDEVPAGIFFRGPEGFFPFERMALDLCRGAVLDFGAGTGVHALALQERGFPVIAVEIVPEALAIMRARGVRRAILGDGLTWEGEPVDTLLMMMNGIGPVGTLDGLNRFLARAGRLLKPGGQILVDSGEARRRERGPGSAPISFPPRTGEYVGEAWIRLEYQGTLGPPFRELYVDSGTLAVRAARAGWRTEVVLIGEGGGYLARLVRAGSGAATTG
jgi:SAM-dependent methyltransferase